jgi:hypothetical protein
MVVEDDSADLYVKRGKIVLMVEYFAVRNRLQRGDYVVVRRRHPSAPDLSENIIRQVDRVNNALILKGLCSDQAKAEDIIYNPQSTDLSVDWLIIAVLDYHTY